jgi:hypothetical protein
MMPDLIPADAIVLLEPQIMSQADNAGGLMTGNVIPDSQVGNLFQPISRWARAYGEVDLQKVFFGVLTDNTATYAGVHMIMTARPEDPRVSAVMMTLDSYTSVRADAQNAIESYLAAGPSTGMRLFEDQLQGARAITVWMHPDEPIPEVGDVLVLSVESDLYAAAQQYVRISKIASDIVRTFRIDTSVGPFEARVLTLEIGTTLRQRFPGIAPSWKSTAISPTRVRETQIADSAVYYGVQPLVVAASVGDAVLSVASVFDTLVPSTQRENPLVDQRLAGDRTVVFASGQGSVRREIAAGISFEGGPFFLGGPVAPGSVIIRAGSPNQLTDNGAGQCLPGVGVTVGYHAEIDYATGNGLMVSDGTTGNMRDTADYVPAGALGQPSETLAIPIEITNRQLTYVFSLNPIPAPGTTRLSFRSLGKWYTASEQGNGEFSGAAIGTLSFATGSGQITLPSYPDAGTAILIAWGTAIHYEARVTTPLAVWPYFVVTLGPCEATTVDISWLSDGVTYTVTDDGSGNLSGADGSTGSINYTTGRAVIRPRHLPDVGSSVDTTVTTLAGGATAGESFTAGSSVISVTLADAPEPGTVEVTWTERYLYTSYSGKTRERFYTRRVRDDGVGGFVNISGATINYVSGGISIPTGITKINAYYSWLKKEWRQYSHVTELVSGSQIQVTYLPANPTTTPAATNSLAVGPLLLDLTDPDGDLPVVPGSIALVLGDPSALDHESTAELATRGVDLLRDRSGSLYANIDTQNNSGVLAGAMDYASGLLSLDFWQARDISVHGATLYGLAVAYGDFELGDPAFRTAGAPLGAGSLIVTATRPDGSPVTATSDLSGNLSGDRVTGTVDQETGVVQVYYGEYLDDAALTPAQKAEEWYDPADVAEGQIWRPWPVLAHTLRYSTVTLTRVPLDADLLGLDPVRLPGDGRVPIYRPGQIAVITETATETLAGPHTAGATVQLPVTGLAEIVIRDAEGAAISAAQYEVDDQLLLDGQVRWADPLDLTGITTPLVAVYRWEDMRQITDVEVTGDITLGQPLAHDYSEAALVASALPYGDRWAHIGVLFSQTSWLNEWLNVQQGNPTLWQYDALNHPIEIDNRGAVTGRWAFVFQSTNSGYLVEEKLGVLVAGHDIASDLAPLNPATGTPYFVIRAAGWGAGGHSIGHCLRFNTWGAAGSAWIARCVLSGPATALTDQIAIQVRGDQ